MPGALGPSIDCVSGTPADVALRGPVPVRHIRKRSTPASMHRTMSKRSGVKWLSRRD